MQKNIFGGIAVLLFGLLLVGGGCETTTNVTGPSVGNTEVENGGGEVDGAPEAAVGVIPHEYPVVDSLDASEGQFVLAVPEEWATDAKKNWIYYGATVAEAGEKQSVLKRLSGKEMTVPNAVIIPIAPGQKAKKGDILLTRWTSGSGMQRALVVGGSETEPEVRYLDIALDNPSEWGEKTDTLKPDQFQMLKDGAVGVTAACEEGGKQQWVRVTGMQGDRVLGVGFAGKVITADKGDCTFAPVKPTVKAGDDVFVANLGKFTSGVVDRVDSAIGRVFVTIQFAGNDKELAVPFGDVLKSL